jgi:hypothetical protein
MKKTVAIFSVFAFLFFPAAKAFPIGMGPTLWRIGTIPAGHYVNLAQVSTPYGDGISVNTIGYPGAFEYGYDFFAYYNETFIVPPTGTIQVKGYFNYSDITPHLDRKYLAVYLLRPDLSGYIANATRILNYVEGDEPGVWYYRSLVIHNLPPGQKFRIAFGRGDLCDMDRLLAASWAAVEVVSCRVLQVPSHYPTISQALTVASSGDIIQVAPGIYHEDLLIDKDALEILGQNSTTTIIDVGIGLTGAGVNITGRSVVFKGFTVRNSLKAAAISIQGQIATITENNVANSTVGIAVFTNSDRITKNNIYNNTQGILIQCNVQNCTLYFNSFYNNTRHVYCVQPCQGVNKWDNGYTGNFWSNSTHVDNNNDGISDVPYIIDPNNIDHHPLMALYLYGDVNHDGLIDIRDLARVAAAFGSYPGQPRWNRNTDVNEDGIVDIRDLVITGVRFGQHRP